MELPDLASQLERILPLERIKVRLIDLVSYASDAGFYYMLPRAVVQPENESEIVALMAFSHAKQIPLTFRAAGTSLSGQSISDGILVDLSKFWKQISVDNNGEQVRVQPGITGGMVNRYLKPYGRKIGPDPSSIDSAMIGGILSNNASGMCCGVRHNSYHTVRHIRFILPDGKVYDTGRKESYADFEKQSSSLFDTIAHIRSQILSDEALSERIRAKYRLKNTVGYSLNAFIDYTHPLDILAHLLIGGEGTLGFISEAVLDTIPDHPVKATALLFFPDIQTACNAVAAITESGAEAVELMDRASLRSIAHLKGAPRRLDSLPESAAALLIEFQDAGIEIVETKVQRFLDVAPSLGLLDPPVFTSSSSEQAALWKLRKGMFPAVGAIRARGTTVILEDIGFPLASLAQAIMALQGLFKKHGYTDAIIFGHAKDGNIHFVVTQHLGSTVEINRYDCFIKDVVELVVTRFNGSLKSEHGTGRNMAPFVETEWGKEAYLLMRELKLAVDPLNLLNPGVIINADPHAHIAHLKPLPVVEEEVDKCIECGFCEPVCPSRDFSMTPRRRIVARRALTQLKDSDKNAYRRLLKEYRFDGIETCSVDGLCANVCPVNINTGDLVKRLRREKHGRLSNQVALVIAKNIGPVISVLNMALHAGMRVNSLLGKDSMTGLTGFIKKGFPVFPLWLKAMRPTTTHRRKFYLQNCSARNPVASVLYFPTCINRIMGGVPGRSKDVPETFLSVSAKVGIRVVVADRLPELCCGQVFSSKGYPGAQAFILNKSIEHLWKASEKGWLPIVIDLSSCTHHLLGCRSYLTEENKERFDQMTIIDSVDYIHDYILPVARPILRKEAVVLHPVCSLHKMENAYKLQRIARFFAREVKVPLHAGCCGMAGDRGFMYPNYIKVSTKPELTEVLSQSYDGYYSSSRTCEIALSEAAEKNYESILYLVDDCLDVYEANIENENTVHYW